MTSAQTMLTGHAEGDARMPGSRMIRELRAHTLTDDAIAEALTRELEMSATEARHAIEVYDAHAAEERRRHLD